MKALVIGATGLLGGAIATHLRDAGHHVPGLARTPEAAERLSVRGITPLAGDLVAGRAAVGDPELRRLADRSS